MRGQGQLRGQLAEARKRQEAEARELNRVLESSNSGGTSVGATRQRIVVVGPCASGKSALVETLREQSYNAHSAAQEHSYVPTMWLMTNPSHLIYLEANLETIKRRRQVSWGEPYLQEENRRLAHARAHADIVLDTNTLSKKEVARRVLEFLASQYTPRPDQTLADD